MSEKLSDQEAQGSAAQERTKLIETFRDLQGGWPDIKAAVETALSNPHAEEIFSIAHPHQKSLAQLQSDFDALREQEDPDATKVSQFMHSMAVALLAKQSVERAA